METNWNQLIERYLQNELSDEGKIAFEEELQLNPELREELEMHQLIQSAAKRASQRVMVKQAGKSYLRNLRMKQFALGVVVTAAATVGIIYAVQNKKQAVNEPKLTEVVINAREIQKDTVIAQEAFVENQPNQTGDKSSLIQSSDWHEVKETDKRNAVSFTSVKRKEVDGTAVKAETTDLKQPMKKVPITFRMDTVSLEIESPKVAGYVYNGMNELVREEAAYPEWMNLYDTVGHFNDLYCGYALVMDHAKIGFVDRKGNLFIPLIYDQIVVTSSIQSSKDKHRRRGKKVLYIPKRSGNEVQYCEEDTHPFTQADSVYLKRKK